MDTCKRRKLLSHLTVIFCLLFGVMHAAGDEKKQGTRDSADKMGRMIKDTDSFELDKKKKEKNETQEGRQKLELIDSQKKTGGNHTLDSIIRQDKKSLPSVLDNPLSEPEEKAVDQISESESTDPSALHDYLDLVTLLETPLEVYAAKKETSSLEEAPAIVSVITKTDILRWGYQSVDEVLRRVFGFYVIDDHTLPNVAIRGFAGGLLGESGTIKVMIDGHSVAYRATSGNWLGPELIPLSAIERIELIRGPVSALYGADAFLGIINIVTKAYENTEIADLRANGLVTVAHNSESYGGLGFDGSVSTRFGSFDVLAAARIQTQDHSGLELPDSSPSPYIPEYNQGQTITRGLKHRTNVGLLKILYQLSQNTSLSLMGYYSSLDRVSAFSPWAQMTFGTDSDGIKHLTRISQYQALAAITANHRFTENAEISANARMFRGAPEDDERIEVGGSNFFYNKRSLDYLGVDLALEYKWKIIPSLTVITGIEDIVHDQQLPSSLRILNQDMAGLVKGDVLESSSTRQGKKILHNFGAFLQLLASPFGKYLNLLGGIRYDENSIYGSQLSGRTGLVSNLFDTLYLKLLFGTAFKAPSPLLLYSVPLRPGGIIGNPDLMPQYVYTVEFYTAYKPIKYFSLSSVVSYSYLQDKAEFTQQGVNLVARNIAEASSLAWETEINAYYKDRLSLYASFELVHSLRNMGQDGYLYELIGNKNVIYPPYIARFGILGRLSFLKVTLEGMFVGPRRASEMNSLEAGHVYELDSYCTFGASISTEELRLWGNRETSIALIVRNLFNIEESDPGYAGVDYPLAPFTLYLQLRQQI